MTDRRQPTRESRYAETSYLQAGLWFLEQLGPGSLSCQVRRAFRVSGGLDVRALRRAWREVIGRHEVLRTNLVEVDGRPMQRIATDHQDPDGDASERYDLATGPLARMVVTRLAPAEHRVLLTAHHVVADERSLSIVVEELSTLYEAAVTGRQPRGLLPPPALQYADYARAQRDQADTPEDRRLRDWWTSTLAVLPAPLELPADRPQPAHPSWDGGLVPFDWGASLSDLLFELTTAERVPPSAVLLAGLQSLLYRYTGDDRLAVGVPVPVPVAPAGSGREELVGPLDNLLVVQADLTGTPSFRSAVDRAARRLRAASGHRELPFSRLLEALPVDRDPRQLPLCEVSFRVREEPPPLWLTGAAVQEERVDPGWILHDLALTVDSVRPVVAGSLSYRTSRFEESTARSILEQLHTLLSAGLAAPDTPVASLPLETGAQTRAALAEADLRSALPVTRPVPESVRRLAQRQPDAVAVACPAGSVSYHELDAHATAIAGALRTLGAAGRPVVVRIPPGPRQIAALLGVLDAGAHLVWLDTSDAGERGNAVLSDLRPACMVVDGEREADRLTHFYRRELAGQVLDIGLLDLASAPPQPSARDVLTSRAYIAYTSGSTGRPKGIAQSHAALAQFVTWLGTEFGLGPGSRVAQWVAPEHDPAICEVFAALVAGATLCPVPERIRANPERFVDWLATERITFLQLVPSFARELLRLVTTHVPPERLAALDRLVLMGEALPAELVNGLRSALPLTRLANVYGPTETVAATWYEITGPLHGTAPIGRPIPGRLVLVLDDLDRPCPAGVPGNLVIQSRYVAPGYLEPASADRAPFQPLAGLPAGAEAAGERTYRTGDLGRRRWDGQLEFRGRRDHQVKIHGTRLELTDLEAALAAHPSVRECAVVPIADRDGLVSRLVAYVVPSTTGSDRGTAGEETGSVDVWRAHLRHRFGRSMMPVLFKVLDSRLPRTVAGKVDRRRLPPFRPRQSQPVPPRRWVEREVAVIWGELLGTGPRQLSDTFFEVGGYSLLVPVLLHRVRERFRVELSLWDFLTDPSLAGLSALVESARRRSVSQPEPAPVDGVPTGQPV